jgi:hypothetical protein
MEKKRNSEEDVTLEVTGGDKIQMKSDKVIVS